MKTKKKPSKKRANKVMPSRKYVNRIVDWCVKTYGKSKYNREFPEIQFRSRYELDDDPKTLAFYDEDDAVIFIKKDEHKTMYQLANTIIHEYTHYKQNASHYHILSLYLPYSKNPMEIEANEVAKRDTRKCLKEVFGKKSIK